MAGAIEVADAVAGAGVVGITGVGEVSAVFAGVDAGAEAAVGGVAGVGLASSAKAGADIKASANKGRRKRVMR